MQAQIRLELQIFWLAVHYLTRLPVPAELPNSDDLRTRSLKYHPLVGAIVGLGGAAVLLMAGLIWPPSVAVILSVAATLLITGGFHEDGLADAVEGLARGKGVGTVLEVMKRQTLGTFGALALAIVLGAKVAALGHLPAWQAATALVIGHMVGRMGAVHIVASTRYARTEGIRATITAVTADGYRIALATTCIGLMGAVLVLGTGAVVTAAVLAIVLGQGFRLYIVARIGGYTGDCLGAVVMLCETGIYLGVLAVL